MSREATVFGIGFGMGMLLGPYLCKIVRNPLFMYFDWLHSRGWLSTKGTFRDYAIVMGSGVIASIPFIVLLQWAMGTFN